MSTYVVFKRNVFVPDNIVFFAYELEDAVRMLDELTAQGDDWAIAEVMDDRAWYVKFLFWLARKINA